MALRYNMHLALREIKGNKNLVEIVSFKKTLSGKSRVAGS